MTKEDKQIIDRAVKEEWRIGDRSRLKRLLEKNLTLYRENVELEQKLEQTEKDLKDIQYYEKNYFDYPIVVRLKRTGSTTFGTSSEIYLFDEKLKKEILNLIKIHFVAEIQQMEKELEEL